jgi:transposase
MLTRELRQTIEFLHQNNKSNRQIAKLLNISRNTVTEVLKQGVEVPALARFNQGTEIAPILREIFMRCSGNAVRVQEILKEEYTLDIAYSTLTRWIQNGELREPVRRVGEYRFEPGQEMQQDTSPHWVMLGEKKTKVQ